MENSSKSKAKPYTLPSWRVNEIILMAVRFLSNEGYFEEGFDYQKAISNKGILIKAYSAFKPENLLKLHEISLSIWHEGLCLVTKDEENRKDCCMIACNDQKSAAQIMQIIFHEYGHIFFGHTEQCPNAEAEAILFSAITTFLMIAEQQFHIARLIKASGGKDNFLQGMERELRKKFNSKEVL